MSTLLNIDRVQYLINQSEESLPLARLYFCIYCKSLKTPDTLQFEVSNALLKFGVQITIVRKKVF